MYIDYLPFFRSTTSLIFQDNHFQLQAHVTFLRTSTCNFFGVLFNGYWVTRFRLLFSCPFISLLLFFLLIQRAFFSEFSKSLLFFIQFIVFELWLSAHMQLRWVTRPQAFAFVCLYLSHYLTYAATFFFFKTQCILFQIQERFKIVHAFYIPWVIT